MREMYRDASETPDSIGDDDVSIDVYMGSDPFTDRFPVWFRIVGRFVAAARRRSSTSPLFSAFVYLSNLLHNVALVHKVAIVDEKGEVRGYLRVRVEPIAADATPSRGGHAGAVRQSARLNFRRENFLKRAGGHGNAREADAKKNTSSTSEGYASSENGEHARAPLTLIVCRDDGPYVDSGVEREELDAEFPSHITSGKEFSFRVTVVETIDVPAHFTDVFCQFK